MRYFTFILLIAVGGTLGCKKPEFQTVDGQRTLLKIIAVTDSAKLIADYRIDLLSGASPLNPNDALIKRAFTDQNGEARFDFTNYTFNGQSLEIFARAYKETPDSAILMSPTTLRLELNRYDDIVKEIIVIE